MDKSKWVSYWHLTHRNLVWSYRIDCLKSDRLFIDKMLFLGMSTQRCKSMSSKMGTEQGEAGWGPGGDWCVGNSPKLWGPGGDTHHMLWCMSLLTHCKPKGLQDWSLFFSLNVSHRGPDLIEGWHYQRCNYFTSINAFCSFRWYLCPFAKVQRFILFVVCFVLFRNILMRHKTDF